MMGTKKEIRIDKKIPMPEITRQGVKKYPFEKMKVGDSFLFINDYKNNRIACQRIVAIAATWVKRHGSKKKFSARTRKNKVRIWRIK